MITYLVGVPGSGKTAYAVSKIIELHDKKNKDGTLLYSWIFNNIAGFKHEKLARSKKYPDDDFTLFAKTLHSKYLEFKKLDEVDDILIDYCKEMGYYKSLIVIDEVHNIFPEAQKTWIWLLSYHRHVFLDFIFITQSMSMISDSKLKNMAENFVKAMPSGKRFFSNSFRYNYYENAAMHNNKKYKTETIKMTPEIFNFYQSGDKVKQKSIVRFFLILFFIMIFVALFLMKYGYSNIFEKGQKTSIKTDKKSHIELPNTDINVTQNNLPGISQSHRDIEIDEVFDEDSEIFIDTYSCMMETCTFSDFYKVPDEIVSFLEDQSMIKVIKVNKYDFDRVVKHALITPPAIKLLSKYKNIEYGENGQKKKKEKKNDYKIDLL